MPRREPDVLGRPTLAKTARVGRVFVGGSAQALEANRSRRRTQMQHYVRPFGPLTGACGGLHNVRLRTAR